MNQFIQWIKDNKALDENGRLELFYHGSLSDFTEFNIDHIRANETDAVFNGFWFTTNKNSASPAWVNPKYIKSFYLLLKNPAPYPIIREVYNRLFDDMNTEEKTFRIFETRYGNRIRSSCDIMRYALQEMGYDGVITADRPNINREEFEATGIAYFKTVRGNKYCIKKDIEWGGVDYYKVYQGGYEEHITGYENYDDFINQHNERVFVVFNPEQIKFNSCENLGIWE